MKLKESDVKTIAEYCGLEPSQVPGLKLLLDTLMGDARSEEAQAIYRIACDCARQLQADNNETGAEAVRDLCDELWKRLKDVPGIAPIASQKPWAVLHAVARDGQEGETRMLYEPGNLEAEIDATFQRLEGSLLREEAWLLEIRDACWMRVTFDQDGRQTIRDAARDDVPEVSMRIVREFVEREAMQALMRSTEPPVPRSKQALALDGESIASLIYERADGWAFTIRRPTQVAVMYSPTDTRKVGCWARSLLAPEAFLRGPELLPYWLRIEAAEGREGAFLIAQELVPEMVRLRHAQLMREGIALAELDEHRGPPGGVSREAFEETLKQAALPSSDPNKRDDGTC